MEALLLGLALLLGPASSRGAASGGPVAQGEGRVTLVFGGDVALGRAVAGRVRAIGGDDAFVGIAGELRAADLAVVNLECALSDRAVAARADDVLLVAPTAVAALIARAGIDAVSLANNHALDAGGDGVAVTVGALAAAGVAVVGGTDVVRIVSVSGLRIALVAVTDRRNRAASDAELAQIAYAPSARLATFVATRVHDAAARADVVVVLVHWGGELVPGPSAAQRAVARAAIDAGAALVIGSGAHVVQEVAQVGAGVVFYSLGNLVFDMHAPGTRRGALARVELDAAKGRVRGWELVGTTLDEDGRPWPGARR